MYAVYFWLKALASKDKDECERMAKLFTKKSSILNDIEFRKV